MPLPAAVLSAGRSAIQQMMDKTATINQKSTTQDPYGGETETFTPLSPTWPCRVMLSQKAAENPGAGGAMQLISGYNIELPHNAPVTEEDQIIVDGVTYEVNSTNGNHSEKLSLMASCSLAR